MAMVRSFRPELRARKQGPLDAATGRGRYVVDCPGSPCGAVPFFFAISGQSKLSRMRRSGPYKVVSQFPVVGNLDARIGERLEFGSDFRGASLKRVLTSESSRHESDHDEVDHGLARLGDLFIDFIAATVEACTLSSVIRRVPMLTSARIGFYSTSRGVRSRSRVRSTCG